VVTVPLAGRAFPPLSSVPKVLRSAALVAVVLVVWQLLASTVFAGRFVVPGPVAVLRMAAKDAFYLSDLRVTLGIS
jgi:ABC-type nitrate/sulfonate/bicarbonate transport system permease component